MELSSDSKNTRFQFTNRTLLIFALPIIGLLVSLGVVAQKNLRLDDELRVASEDLRSIGAFSDQQLRLESFVIYNAFYGPPKKMEVVVVYDDVGGGFVPITREYFVVLRMTLRNISSIREVFVERPDFPQQELSDLIAEFPNIRFYSKYVDGEISEEWKERMGETKMGK